MIIEEFMRTILSYEPVLAAHQFVLSGGGVLPWSNRHTNATGHIDVRHDGWIAYDLNNVQLANGGTSGELKAYLERHLQ